MTQERDFNAILSTLKAVQAVKDYAHLIRPSEVLINDVRDLSVVLLRRQLGISFKNHIIRKNQSDYSIRLENEDLVNALIAIKKFYDYRDIIRKFSEEIQTGIRSVIDPMFEFFNMMSRNNGHIRYTLKSDNRFFMYVPISFMDTSIDSYGDFESNSISTRISKSIRLGEILDSYEGNEMFNSVLNIVLENDGFEFTRFTSVIDSDFLQHYNSLNPNHRNRRAYQCMRDYQSSLIQEATIRGEEEPVFEPLSEQVEVISVRPTFSLIYNPNDSEDDTDIRIDLPAEDNDFVITNSPHQLIDLDDEYNEETRGDEIRSYDSFGFNLNFTAEDYNVLAVRDHAWQDENPDASADWIMSEDGRIEAAPEVEEYDDSTLRRMLQENRRYIDHIESNLIDYGEEIEEDIEDDVPTIEVTTVDETIEDINIINRAVNMNEIGTVQEPRHLSEEELAEYSRLLMNIKHPISVSTIDLTENEILDDEVYVTYDVNNADLKYSIVTSGEVLYSTKDLLFIEMIFFAAFGHRIVEIIYRREDI